MLPPLTQLTDARTVAEAAVTAGPPRDALQRPSAPSPSPTAASFRSAGANPQHRRVSVAKPPPPSSSLSSAASAGVYASPRRATYRPSILSPRVPIPSSATDCDVQPLPQGGTASVATPIETISRVPREFFVIETNAVLPVMQYPPAQYQSTFVGGGAWETVVFPALTPHTRHQVLCLRQALEAMRVRAAMAGDVTGNSDGVVAATLAAEYTEKEWALHSVCFHELARQIKFICREQSELLFEIQAAYDASVARLVALVRRLQQQLDAQHTQLAELREQLHTAKQTVEHGLSNQRDAGDVVGGRSAACPCGRRSHDDRKDDAEDFDDNDDDDEDAWRAFQRQRRLCLREFAKRARDGDDDGDDDDSDGDGGGGRGRLQRASIVEENTAAARVQQAFTKYQQRKEAARQLQWQEKKEAALDIQRSYRGYRERKRALHHRAVMHTILRRRKQVAAVELLQMNVRAYLIKKRREEKYGIHADDTGEPTTAHASMLEAQRAAVTSLSSSLAASSPTRSSEDAQRSVAPSPAPSSTSPPPAEQDLAPGDRFAQLLNSMSELAAAFSFLHSRRRNAKKALVSTATTAPDDDAAATAPSAMGGDDCGDRTTHDESIASHIVTPVETTVVAPATEDATKAEDARGAVDIDDAERELLDATLCRAEDLVVSFKAVINDLRQGDTSLTKATSTASLTADSDGGDARRGHHRGDTTASLMDALGSAALLFLDNDPHGGTNTARDEPDLEATMGGATSLSPLDDPDDEDGDDTHLDDVLWQASVFAPASTADRADEASARQLLLRELVASRDQQKRLVTLKQLIADVYDTVVGKLRELPRARLDKLVRVHASLALSFADARRLLRGPARRHHTASTMPPNDYEPVSAFVGRLELQALLHDHFQRQLGLAHLVDAASERVAADLRHFAGLDADVQRFHEYLTRGRSLDDLVFFCLCRLFAQDSGSARQPVFHRGTLRELVDAKCAMAVATKCFLACGDDAAMVATDAFVIEPGNEIYARHLPSNGLAQLDAVLRDLVSPVAAAGGDNGELPLRLDEHLRATNASRFHAPAYNASAPRSPLRHQYHETPPSDWLFFTELVDVLRRYRSAMRHFHAFVQWTYELFHEAYRAQRQQLLLSLDSHRATPSGTPLLEEAAFVATLLPYSRGASGRELRNVFHNALKQRALQRLMPVRVFVSVVLVLLRNGLLSVTSYKPLAPPAGSSSGGGDVLTPSVRTIADASYLGSHRQRREETQWVQLALHWRAHEPRFEAAIERLYARGASDTSPDNAHAASQLLQWRNELYELFVLRSGREHLQRAQRLYELLSEGLARVGDEGETGEAAGGEESVPETDDQEIGSTVGALERLAHDAGAAAAVGSPWATETPSANET